MRAVCSCLLGLLCVLLSGSVKAEERTGLSLKGYLQTDLSLQALSVPDVDAWLAKAPIMSGNGLLSLQVRTQGLPQAKLEGILDVVSLYGRAAALYQQYNPAGSLVTGAVPVYAELRKLSATYSWERVDLSLGRQIINMGTGTVYSPVDVFSEVELLELNFRRRGSDTVRVRVALDPVSGFEAVASLPTYDASGALTAQTTSLRLFSTVAGWDVSGLALYRLVDDELLGGLAVKGDLLLGVKGELLLRRQAGGRSTTVEGMVGADYSVGGQLFVQGEYYYRDAALPSLPLYDVHNVFGSVRYTLDELTHLALVALVGLPREDLILTAQVSYNAFQGVELTGFVRSYRLEADADTGLLPKAELGLRTSLRF